MKKLIINADDFGLHPEINHAVLKGHKEGCITSTSLMATGGAFAEAADIARQTPTLGIGVHLTLVAEAPVLLPKQVPTLIADGGKFPAAYGAFISRYVRGQVSLQEIEAEFAAQIEKVLNSGICVTHLDSHQHLHVLPAIAEICIVLAKRYGIRAMRIPAEPYTFTGGYPAAPARWLGRGGLTFLANRARRRFIAEKITAPAHFFGMLAGGHMTADYLEKIVAILPDGVSEIMMHPGGSASALGQIYPWGYHWEDESAAVLYPPLLARIRQEGIKLCSFGELSHE